jgi:hypothetical protein
MSIALSANATTSGMSAIIANLLSAGCIDNAGIANAFASKLATAQMAVGGGQIQTAINVLMAFRDQVQAQSGKHIAASCALTFTLIVTGSAEGELRSASASVSATFAPATILTNEVVTLIASLKASVNAADPITGFVVDSSGNGVAGAMVSILNSPLSTPVPGAVATTDMTGFYFFATTSSLTVGSSYSVRVTGYPTGSTFTVTAPSYPPFTWAGKGLAFNFTLQ